MMLLHDLPHYYRENEGTEILSRTFESNEVLTPFQIPSRPTVSQDRYKEFRESFHCCKLPQEAEREHGGIAVSVLSEDHRAKDESPCTFIKAHQHYSSGVDPWTRVLPTEQHCDVTQLKKRDMCMNDELLHKPPDSLAKPLCLPFPTSHPYETHISRYAMFPNFRSPEDQDTGIDASSNQPFHPNIPTKAFDVVVLRKTRGILLHRDFDRYFVLEDFKDHLHELMGSPWQLDHTGLRGIWDRKKPAHLRATAVLARKGNLYRHEVVSIPSDSQKKAVHWPGQHTYFQLPKIAGEKGQIYYPNPPKIVAPNSTFKELEHNLSPRTANMLRNTERALGITTYSRDFTGRGPMNPLILDNYYMKAVGRLTGELGEDVELKETFLPSLSQVRPLEGRTARLLQGRRPRESILQEQHSSSVQMPPSLGRVPTVVASHSDTMLSKIKTAASLGQQRKVTESADQKWDVSQEQATLPQTYYQEVHYLDTRPQKNKLQKITDTLQTEALYREKLSGRPELESLPKSARCHSCEDFRASHLDRNTLWEEDPFSLSKPGLPLGVNREESRMLLHKLWHQEACQAAWRPEDGPRETALPEWSCEVPQRQTALLELQHSFSKTAAQKHFHDTIRGETKDLRDNMPEGKRHKFYGFNAFYFFN